MRKCQGLRIFFHFGSLNLPSLVNRNNSKRLHVVYSFKSGVEKLLEIYIPRIGNYHSDRDKDKDTDIDCNCSISGECGEPYQEDLSCLVNCTGGPFEGPVLADQVHFFKLIEEYPHEVCYTFFYGLVDQLHFFMLIKENLTNNLLSFNSVSRLPRLVFPIDPYHQ